MYESEYMIYGAVALVSVLLFILSFISVRRANKRTITLQKSIRDLENTIRALTTGSVGLGERLVALEQRARRLASRQDDIDLRESTVPFDQAKQLVDEGGDTDKLVSSCGVSRGEAELIVNLHKFSKAS